MNIAIFASGAGSNASKLIEKASELNNITIATLITDQEDAGIINYCQSTGQTYQVISKKNLSREEHEYQIIKALRPLKIDLILLAGYMRLLSKEFIHLFSHPQEKHSRIINIHPSLLPKYPGLSAYEQAFTHESTFSGITIHYVDTGMDTGEIILQNKFYKHPQDSLVDFKSRGLKLEHQMYPYLLEVMANNTKNYPTLESL